MLRLQIKVVPGASRESVEWLGDQLKVRVRAAPEKGQANAAVEKLLMARLGTAVNIVSGFASPRKIVEIPALDLPTLKLRLAAN